MERHEQKFCGILLLTWEEWDEISIDMIQFYNVEFPMESMKQYSGCVVSLTFSGKLEVYDPFGYSAEPLWCGYVTDILEIMEELKNRF